LDFINEVLKEDLMKGTKPLSIAYTPDSDDAFYYDALETKQVVLPGFEPVFVREPMSVLNQKALRGAYDVTAISSVVYPSVVERYAILSVGTSVGRGYGPVLVGKKACRLTDLRGKRVGVGGIPTTGWFLLRLVCPGAIPVEMPYDKIANAVCSGALCAGVMIHEELLYYTKLGLVKIVDLGAEWSKRYDLPLPVGLNVIRRDLGSQDMLAICRSIRRSLEHGLVHAGDTLSRVSRFGRGLEGGCTEQFVSMFANQDSVHLPQDVRVALHVLFCQLADAGLIRSVPEIEIIEDRVHHRPSTTRSFHAREVCTNG
jgi:1,4-dihydroxy-6-naphthoate synthase